METLEDTTFARFYYNDYKLTETKKNSKREKSNNSKIDGKP
jgi:hypothetical protein